MKHWISVCLSILVVSTAVNGSRLGRCPADWFTAQIILTADRIVPQNLPASNRDLDLTFFREELRFSEAEIDLARQSAIDFFYTRFGLDFSQTDPYIPERRVFQNATFEPFFLTVPFTASVDRWIVNGNTRSGRCFNTREGGFVVDFTSNQVLRGTYGGTEGIVVAPGENMAWAYYSINAYRGVGKGGAGGAVAPPLLKAGELSPTSFSHATHAPFLTRPPSSQLAPTPLAYDVAPLLILLTSRVPARTTADGIILDSNLLFHRTLGRGSENSVNTFTPIANSTNFRFVTRRILVFPDERPAELLVINNQ